MFLSLKFPCLGKFFPPQGFLPTSLSFSLGLFLLCEFRSFYAIPPPCFSFPIVPVWMKKPWKLNFDRSKKKEKKKNGEITWRKNSYQFSFFSLLNRAVVSVTLAAIVPVIKTERHTKFTNCYMYENNLEQFSLKMMAGYH